MSLIRHSGARAKRASPESITPAAEYGFRAQRFALSRNDKSRRAFITLLGGVAAAWPLAANAEQRERMRRIGLLIPYAADETETLTRVGAFQQSLQQLGWAIG